MIKGQRTMSRHKSGKEVKHSSQAIAIGLEPAGKEKPVTPGKPGTLRKAKNHVANHG